MLLETWPEMILDASLERRLEARLEAGLDATAGTFGVIVSEGPPIRVIFRFSRALRGGDGDGLPSSSLPEAEETPPE